MDHSERVALFAIQRIFNFRPRAACAVIREAGSAASAFEGDRRRFRCLMDGDEDLWASFERYGDWAAAERDSRQAKRLGVEAIGFGGASYPKLLAEIHDPPPLLLALGEGLRLLASPAVAIVGSRKASRNGREVAFEIARTLSDAGFAVVSGMAYGIDAAAHAGAIEGARGTLAVLGCGPEITYPPSHASLSARIKASGAVVSEFPFGTTPYPSNFPRRNRIISGISLATVVVEAAERSGSLITARLALEQGREVGACPGLAGSPAAKGANRLIRDGAHLVECGEDVLDLLAAHLPPGVISEKPGLLRNDVAKDTELLRAISEMGVAGADEIIAAVGCEASRALEGLTRLAMAGRIEELPGNRFGLKAK